jgi:hypothetical protein
LAAETCIISVSSEEYHVAAFSCAVYAHRDKIGRTVIVDAKVTFIFLVLGADVGTVADDKQFETSFPPIPLVSRRFVQLLTYILGLEDRFRVSASRFKPFHDVVEK